LTTTPTISSMATMWRSFAPTSIRANLKRLGVPFHVEAAAVPADGEWNGDGHPIVRVTHEQIAELVSAARRVLVF